MLSVRDLRSRRGDETGAVTVIFALLLTLFMIIGSLVITVGSWYTHARQLQTKVDAAALAGGGAWSFPCNQDADTRIATTGRVFFGEHTAADGSAIAGAYNQQIGSVEGDQLYVSMNQADWWDDTFPNVDFTSPAGSVCSAKSLEVKATEDDSPLLWGWLPFFPDIKKRAKVELRQAIGLNGLLPIGVRVPKPVSSAAIFFDEADGRILAVRYFAEDASVPGMPAGYEGFSTKAAPTASISGLPRKTGVAVALSFVPACVSTDTPSPCFEDEGFTTVNQLCNQGTGTQVVSCYSGSGAWPTRNVTTGLHFMRGWLDSNVGNGPPELRGAFLVQRGLRGERLLQLRLRRLVRRPAHGRRRPRLGRVARRLERRAPLQGRGRNVLQHLPPDSGQPRGDRRREVPDHGRGVVAPCPAPLRVGIERDRDPSVPQAEQRRRQPRKLRRRPEQLQSELQLVPPRKRHQRLREQRSE